jgi:hypothetical protein
VKHWIFSSFPFQPQPYLYRQVLPLSYRGYRVVHVYYRTYRTSWKRVIKVFVLSKTLENSSDKWMHLACCRWYSIHESRFCVTYAIILFMSCLSWEGSNLCSLLALTTLTTACDDLSANRFCRTITPRHKYKLCNGKELNFVIWIFKMYLVLFLYWTRFHLLINVCKGM